MDDNATPVLSCLSEEAKGYPDEESHTLHPPSPAKNSRAGRILLVTMETCGPDSMSKRRVVAGQTLM